jgi:hypothetical protein
LEVGRFGLWVRETYTNEPSKFRVISSSVSKVSVQMKYIPSVFM